MYRAEIGRGLVGSWVVAGVVALAALVPAGAASAATAVPGPASGAAIRPAAASTCTHWTSSSTPPSTIKVLIYQNHDKNGAGSTKLRVDTVAFQTYVKDVLPNEWLSGWKPAALQAGAVAAKQYAWYYTMNTGHGGTFNGSCYDVTDDIGSQRYIPGSNKGSTNAAVDATWGVTLKKSGALFPTSYQATLTGNAAEACGSGLSRYPNVMSQDGSQNCAVAGRTSTRS